jgi:biotin transport system substrate-specific component
MAVTISSGTTLTDHFLPLSKSYHISFLRDILLIISFSIFLAICAQVSFHIPNTTVPVTLQTLGVLLTGATLGSRRGGMSLLIYLAEGAAGMPVFAGGAGGFIRLLGPTGGYLLAYPIAAYVTGWLCERGLDRSFRTSVLAMLPGSFIIYALGVPWLGFVLHLSLPIAFAKGMLPFLPGDSIKLLVATALLPTAWKLTRSDKTTNRKHKF